jgi:hypothetical protein
MKIEMSKAESLVLKRAIDNEIDIARKTINKPPEAINTIKKMGLVPYKDALKKYIEILETIRKKMKD